VEHSEGDDGYNDEFWVSIFALPNPVEEVRELILYSLSCPGRRGENDGGGRSTGRIQSVQAIDRERPLRYAVALLDVMR